MNSLYIPKHFHVQNLKDIIPVLNQNPFATVMSLDAQKRPFFSHIPLVVKRNGSKISLLGHMARANAQWKHFSENPDAHIIFHGPHCYITPTWYKSGRDVPTWNYVVIHIQGSVKLIESFDGILTLLSELTEKFESPLPNPWDFELPEDLNNAELLTRAIVGFEVTVNHIEAKFKLGQNRDPEDSAGVIEGLEKRGDEMSKEILKLMSLYGK